MIEFSFIYVAHFYVALLFVFSICLVVVGGKLNRRPALLWLLSNFMAGMAMEIFLVGEVEFKKNMHPLIFVFQSTAPLVKFLALAHGWRWSRIKWYVYFILGLLLIIPLSAISKYRIDLQTFMISAGAVSATIACVIAVIYNRYWKGFAGRALMGAYFIMVAGGVMWRAVESFNRGTIYLSLETQDELVYLLTYLAGLGFIGQMAFLLLLTSRTQRYDQIKERRAERIRARSVSLMMQNKEISRLLDEQRRMLETLTHEVRQPINNAQAALQGIISELKPEHANQKRVLPVAARIQGILDGITLSLSNAIIGATLVERGESPDLRDCEITSIAQLALLDCPANVRERVVFDAPENDIFLPVDPILLRLALRNLLDNAAKFSLPGTEIVFSVGLDEARFGVLIAVTNAVPETLTFACDLLGRGKRGPDAAAKDGSGIGLYIVSEVARIHDHEMVIDTSVSGRITFGILLSE